MTRALVGRSDLLRVLDRRAEGDAKADHALRRLVGKICYDVPVPEDEDAGAPSNTLRGPSDQLSQIVDDAAREDTPSHAVPLHMPTRFAARKEASDSAEAKPRTPPTQVAWRRRPTEAAPFSPLADPHRLAMRVRGRAPSFQDAGRPDMAAAVDLAARLRPLGAIPRKRRRAPTPRIIVALDVDARHAPFAADTAILLAAFRDVFTEPSVSVIPIRDASRRSGAWRTLVEAVRSDGHAASMVVAVTDLGATSEARSAWAKLGRGLAERGVGRIAVAPYRLHAAHEAKRSWIIEPMDASPRAPDEGEAAARLLALTSPAIRIEPQLLRAMRTAFFPQSSAALEALFWRSGDLESDHPEAATIRHDRRRELRDEFDRLPEADRRKALAVIRRHRATLSEAIWFEELVNLSARTRALSPYLEDVEDAQDYFAALRPGAPRAEVGSVRAWMARVGERAGEAAWRDPEFRAAVAPVVAERPGSVPDGPPELLPGKGAGPLCIHVLGAVVAVQCGAEVADGSAAAVLPSDNGVVDVCEAQPVPYWPGEKPAWIADWGEDEHGHWVAFEFEGVRARLRWCPPGRFLMGSPEDEEGRWDDEGPQVEITFADGFWMMETTVTQALYRAVTGDDPSEIKCDDRPVEQVSYEDAAAFIAALNARLQGLDLALPSEAAWEYACRAGTTVAHVTGDAPDPDFIHFEAKETAPVSAKRANPWGLRQMLGNVEEWCIDAWSENHEGADPSGHPRPVSEEDSDRVVRGGSWSVGARVVRAAYRNRVGPRGRRDNLGFRCARGRVAGGQDVRPPGAERSGGDGRRARGAPGDRPALTAGARLEGRVVRRGGGAVSLPLPPAPFVLRTDRAELAVEALRLSDLPWADALGRDRYGLWADFVVEDARARLRWCPPGRFLMGSPDDEPGQDDEGGPLTEITLERGFWLMDAPVTQALFEAVLGADANESQFRHPERPVENVDFDAAETFIHAVNDRKELAGIDLHLPSEAEWEYACRAGTTDATWAGPMEIKGENNAPILDEIAWYGGNSGAHGFDLEDGYDSSHWPEKEYDHTKAGTRIVKTRAANPWGLHDMLGNVWEWCEDGWGDSHEGADPSGHPRPVSEEDSRRVVRGGSWSVVARAVRAACRSRDGPWNRHGTLGFRCARGRVPVGPGARPAGAERAGAEAGGGEAEPTPPGRSAGPRSPERKG